MSGLAPTLNRAGPLFVRASIQTSSDVPLPPSLRAAPSGKGWGIDDKGMATYAKMTRQAPDFFIHTGDIVCAEGPKQDTVETEGQGGLEKHHADRRKAQGGRDAEPIPRPVEIQHDGRARSGDERPNADVRPMG